MPKHKSNFADAVEAEIPPPTWKDLLCKVGMYTEIFVIAVIFLLTGPLLVAGGLAFDRHYEDIFDDDLGIYLLLIITVIPVSIWLFIVIMLKGT